MKRELYENYLLMKHLYLSINEINSLEPHIKCYYICEIEKFLNKK